MTKKKIAGTKNVYELAQERLKVIFNEFDNIYVSFSGGKDSGVLLNMCIDYIRKNNLKVRLGVFHMDYKKIFLFIIQPCGIMNFRCVLRNGYIIKMMQCALVV